MADFLSPLEVRMLPESDDQNWMLISPLVYYSDITESAITVPAGFVTDFVSFEALKNIGQRPAVIHDHLYTTKEVPRAVADAILLEALISVGVDKPLALTMYSAVKMFGRSHYKEDV